MRPFGFRVGRVLAAAGVLALASCLLSGTASQVTLAKGARTALPSGRAVLAKAMSEAKAMGTFRSTGTLTGAETTGAGKNQEQRFFRLRLTSNVSLSNPEREEITTTDAETFRQETITYTEHQIRVGQELASRATNQWSCSQVLSTDAEFSEDVSPDYPFNVPAKYIVGAQVVAPSSTFGVPTWFVRVRYKTVAVRSGVSQTLTVNEFIARSDDKLLRLVSNIAINMQALREHLLFRERFGHYGEPLNIHLPYACRVAYGGY